MTHTRQMDDAEGEFTGWQPTGLHCHRCDGECQVRKWESSCGGWEDYQYRCLNPACRYTWWVDGIDS